MEKETNNPKAPWWQPGLLLFSKLSGWIGGPVILALFIGRWLDGKYGTEPWLFLLSVGAAFIVSTIGITKETIKEIKKIEKEAKEAKELKTKN